MRSTFAVVVTVGALGLACGGGEYAQEALERELVEAAIEAGGANNAELGSDGSASIVTDEGTFTMGAAAKLPDNFPPAFAPGPDAKLLSVSDSPMAALVMYESPKDANQVCDAHTAAAKAAGWKLVANLNDGSGQINSFTSEIGASASVTCGPDGERTVVSIGLNRAE